MARHICFLEAVLEQTPPHRIVGREGNEAPPDVAGWWNLECRCQSAGRPAVVRNRDDGIDAARVTPNRKQSLSETGPAADGHDRGAVPVGLESGLQLSFQGGWVGAERPHPRSDPSVGKSR